MVLWILLSFKSSKKRTSLKTGEPPIVRAGSNKKRLRFEGFYPQPTPKGFETIHCHNEVRVAPSCWQFPFQTVRTFGGALKIACVMRRGGGSLGFPVNPALYFFFLFFFFPGGGTIAWQIACVFFCRSQEVRLSGFNVRDSDVEINPADPLNRQLARVLFVGWSDHGPSDPARREWVGAGRNGTALSSLELEALSKGVLFGIPFKT